MPGVDLSPYKVAAGEVLGGGAGIVSKFNNLVQAIQDELGDIDPDQISGFPADATKYLAGDGAWKPLPQVLIGDIDLTVTQQFASIPQVYRALRMIVFGRTTSVAVTDPVNARFNGDSGANYDQNNLQGNNGAASSAVALAATLLSLGTMPGNTATANRMGACELFMPGYAGTAFHKLATVISHSFSTSAAANLWVQLRGNLWRNTAAVNQIDILVGGGGVFAAGSRAYLYGVN